MKTRRRISIHLAAHRIVRHLAMERVVQCSVRFRRVFMDSTSNEGANVALIKSVYKDSGHGHDYGSDIPPDVR